METSKLEVYITQKDAGRGVYISFPTTRQALRRAFKKAHIPLNDWKIAALKTGSDVFSEAVLACRNLDELNLLGFWLSQLSEKQYDAFSGFATPAAPREIAWRILSTLRQTITMFSAGKASRTRRLSASAVLSG